MTFRSLILAMLLASFAALVAREACDCTPSSSGVRSGGGVVSTSSTDAGDAGSYVVIHIAGYDAGPQGGY